MSAMLPLLIVALLIWAGVFIFMLSIDRKVSALERRLNINERRGGKEEAR
jgi:CcmD family protein